jgi:putative membrane protein
VLALGGAGGSGPAGRGSDRAYVVATSAADTATAVFAVASLAVLGAPRSGVTVAVDTLGGEAGTTPTAGLGFVGMLLVLVLAAGVGIVLLVTVGDRYLGAVRRLPRRPLVVGVLGLLVALAVGFAGAVGGAVFCLAAVVGLLPPRVGARRVHLMGVLIGPVALG